MSFAGPLPSQLCLLQYLPSREVGEKVRFSGCVTSYSIASAVLTLEHQLPSDDHFVRALVDVKLVLERLGTDQTRIGEWVNVIGYITAINPPPAPAGERTDSGECSKVQIQAILLWSAGPLDMQRYNTSVGTVTALATLDGKHGGRDGSSHGILPSGS
ncbi:CST complex subunit Ten1 [Podospora didyma]|uniref:CST complex subunit Ten1 n=1 Tax=Podospora didyma TaxID=330526 RepID=A0AAE0KK95_9PEZI|nr:CST complex subunit Ten1 [Podospora didyma]